VTTRGEKLMMSDALASVLIIALAAYRLSSLVALDDGPFYVFRRIRIALETAAEKHPFWDMFADGWHCRFCTGVWFSVLLGLAWYCSPSPDIHVLIMLIAAAGVQELLTHYGR